MINRHTWDRRSHIYRNLMESSKDHVSGCVQYFVAGHLPGKENDYKKKFRPLASTYVTYSPNGKELLVNLGGEQIYLFDAHTPRNKPIFSTSLCDSTTSSSKEGK